MVLEVNDAGELILPAEVVQAASHTRRDFGREGEAVVLRPVARDTSGFYRSTCANADRPGLGAFSRCQAEPIDNLHRGLKTLAHLLNFRNLPEG